MKLSFAIFTLFGFLGAWLVIELSPHPADQRFQEFKKLPGVENLVEWSELRPVRQAFERADEGTVTFTRDGVTSTWASIDEWKTDFDAFDRNARYWYNQQQNANRFEEARAKAQTMARAQAQGNDEGGSLSALRNLAMLGVGQTSDGASVTGMLRGNGGATSQMSLEQFVQGSMDMSSRSSLLKSAQAMQQNMRMDGMTDQMFAQTTQQNRQGLEQLRRQAEAGDPDAKWVWGKLHGDTKVRIRVPN